MRFTHRIAAAVLAVATSGAGIALATAPANAAPMTAKVTVIHGIPNTPVDVYVNGKVLLKSFVFGKVAGPLSLAPAAYAIAVRPAGAAAASKAILAATVKVTAGENATIVANLTAAGAPTLSVFANPTTAIAMGKTRIIVRHVAAAPGVDVYAGTSKVITNLTNPKQGILTIPAANGVAISVDVTGTMTKVIGPATFNFAEGKTTIVYAIGSAAGKTLTVAVQKY